jgi:hypothetical protein
VITSPTPLIFIQLWPHSPAKVDTHKADRGPLPVTAGGKDRTVPATVSRATVRPTSGLTPSQT